MGDGRILVVLAFDRCRVKTDQPVVSPAKRRTLTFVSELFAVSSEDVLEARNDRCGVWFVCVPTVSEVVLTDQTTRLDPDIFLYCGQRRLVRVDDYAGVIEYNNAKRECIDSGFEEAGIDGFVHVWLRIHTLDGI
ncbi:hypothetical protein [Natrialba sp. SSL1]|uniref:hypothetical protein n=1 Tax=Natrialba sp. SSL1 TaxID=1869245 RepID=UPI00111424FE|nr:hypothetical protein [Natrialba sp. SSL1]